MSSPQEKALVNKTEMLKEHKRIIPMLRKGGFKKEARKQLQELKEYK